MPAHIPRWKCPPKQPDAVSEPHEWFQVENEVTADHVLFNFAEETFPVMATDSGAEAVIIHTQATLG